MPRILVVDRSDLLAWVVNRLAPPDTVIERASSFADAKRTLLDDPPDAAIFSLERCHASWRALIDCCIENPRTIPFVCTGELEHFDACGCELPCRMEDFMPGHATADELAGRIASLIGDRKTREPHRIQRSHGSWADEYPDRRENHAQKT